MAAAITEKLEINKPQLPDEIEAKFLRLNLATFPWTGNCIGLVQILSDHRHIHETASNFQRPQISLLPFVQQPNLLD